MAPRDANPLVTPTVRVGESNVQYSNGFLSALGGWNKMEPDAIICVI